MADTHDDERFEKLLKEFEEEHWVRTRGLHAHMKAALDILESKKDGLRHGSLNVQHTPISARLKDKSKALRTLRRRQEDRKQLVELKRLVEARQESWHEYCKIWNMEDKEYEAEPFTSIEQMFTAMHDLAGIRISVYFPNDVQKVVDFLDEKFHIVDGPSRKGGMTRDFQKVRKLVERQRQMKDAPEDRRISPAVESTFAGYRATHVVIQHKSLDFDEHARGDRITNIEIQIGSIIMHAWSDIEHDILYKPSGAGETSPDVVRMLDLINGIVMTGEVALQQLASVAAAEATRQAEDRTQQAMNWQYMVPWLDRYFNDRKIPLAPRNEWLSMRFLFEILKATDDHTFGRVEELLEEMDPKPDERLPVMMLHHIGRETYPFEDRGFEPFSLATTWNARYWATCLVNALNLAIFMSSSPNLYRTMWYYSKEVESIHNYRPTFAEFLDILHPTKPRRRTDRESRMIDFCKRVLSSSSKFNPQSHALAAMKLASAGYVVRPRLSDEEEAAVQLDEPFVFVPALLKRLTYDSLIGFRIALSSINDELPDDDQLYFIPHTADGDQTAVWKPIRRESGNKWVITKTPFSNEKSKSLAFEDDKLGRRLLTEHLCRVLDIDIAPEEVNTLRKLAVDLKFDDKPEEVRALIKNTRTLNSTELEVYRMFLKARDGLKVDGNNKKDQALAELARLLQPNDAEELIEYYKLSRSQDTKDPEELRALKHLASSYGIEDPEELRALREQQRGAEESPPEDDDERSWDETTNSRGCLPVSSEGDIASPNTTQQQYRHDTTQEILHGPDSQWHSQQNVHQYYDKSQDEAAGYQPSQEWQGHDSPEQTYQVPQDHVQTASTVQSWQNRDEPDYHRQQQSQSYHHNHDERQRSQQLGQNEGYSKDVSSHGLADETKYSMNEGADDKWRRAKDGDDDSHLGVESSAGLHDDMSNETDGEAQSETKRDKFIKGFGALRTSWNAKYKR